MSQLPTDDNRSPSLGGQHQEAALTAREPGLTGEAALAHLVQALGDRDPAARRRAVAAMQDLGAEEVMNRLMSTLSDGDAAARSRAANALGQIGGDETINALIEVFDNEEDIAVASTAGYWLGMIGDPRALPVLLSTFGEGAYHPRRRAVREISVSAIKKIAKKHPDAAWNLFEHQVFSRDSHVHYQVWLLLRTLKLEPIIVRFIEIASDTNTDDFLRIRAIQGLGAMHDPRASAALIGVLREGGTISYWAARALKHVRERKDIPDLILLLQHEDWQVRMRAADILGRRAVKRAVPALIVLADDPRSEVRRIVVRALGRIGVSQAHDILTRLSKDRSKPVRRMADSAIHSLCWKVERAKRKQIRSIFD